MLSADEDITTELDRVVCRLMKLALKSSKGKQAPPPARWMQCKLLDLLTLTEKSISRRRRHFIESFPLKAIGFGPNESDYSIRLRKVKKNDDTAALELLDKYKHLIQLSDVPYSNDLELVDFLRDEEDFTDFEFTETAVAQDPVYEYDDNPGGKVYKPVMQVNADDSSLDRTQAWVEEDNYLAIVSYLDNKSAVISSPGHSITFGVRYRYNKKPYKTHNNLTNGLCNRSFSKIFDNRYHQTKPDDKKGKNSKTNLPRKGRRRNAVDYGKHRPKAKRRAKEQKKLQPTASKPIPGRLIELCHPELTTNADGFNFPMSQSNKDRNVANEPTDKVAATKESLLVNIVMDDMEETIALRRTIGTDADVDPTAFEQETVIESPLNVERNDSLNNMHHIATENVHSQTIFLYDINEPSTSKGVRHLSTDVQCGPDTMTAVPMVSPANSVPRLPKMFSTGFRMRDSLTNLVTTENTSEFGTSTNNIENFGPTSQRLKFSNMFKSGIKIKDSSENVTPQKKSADCGYTINNEYTLDKSLNVFTSSIKIGVSASDFTVRKSSGTCTDHNKTVIPRARAKDFTPNVRSNTSNSATSTGHDNHATISLSPRVNRKNKTKHSSGNITIKSSDFGTSTDERYRTLSPIVIARHAKDSDTSGKVHKKVECATPICVDEISDIQTYASATETKLLKPISSGIIEDSCSEFYGSCCSASSPGRCTSSMRNTSLLRRSKLSCGGVHIHSYKEKHVSEDVVYQGKWQRYKSKAHSRMKPYNPISVKKATDIKVKKIKYSNSKHKISVKEAEIKSKVELKPLRRHMPIKAKQEPVKIDTVKKVFLSKSVVKAIRSNRNITKVTSNITTSSMLSKNTKCTRFVKIPTKVPLPEMKKDGDAQKKQTYQSYLPLYLKRRKPTPDKTNLNQSFDSVRISTKINKPKEMLPATMSNPEEIKCSLVKFSDQPQENVNYAVFRNEIENTNRGSTDPRATDSPRKRNTSRRSSSPASQNSSTCSTPDSIATVRAVTTRSRASTRRHSTSSNKSSLGNTESETTTPVRNRKFTKRGKSTKRNDDKDHDKENKPESSKLPFSNREQAKIEKTAFKGRNKNVYMAQVTSDGSPSKVNPQTPNKSSIRIPNVDNKVEIEKKKRPVTTTTSQKKPIIKSNNSACDLLSEESKHNENTDSDNSNNLLPSQSQQKDTNNLLPKEQENLQGNTPPIVTPYKTSSDLTNLDNQLLSQWLESSSQSTIVSTAENSIIAAMRHIVEDRLDFLEQTPQKYYDLSNSELKLAIEELNKQSIEETLSLSSFKTAMTNENNLNGTLKSDTEDFNVTFDATLDDSLQSLIETTPPTTDLDLLSFKSLTSVSRYSEILVVDSQSPEEAPQTEALPVVSSVREIFERKEQQIVQLNPPGTLAIQIFSGFSMNSAPVVGDRPDYVNLIDSETGSVAMEFARQVTSEELLVSGRSSSYESCFVDEDADIVVPNWLFEIINQQQSVDQEEEEEPLQQQQLLLPMPMPRPVLIPHEQFDANGNVTEGLGVGAGAGDGRGMHSDHSQDSSGRGTSLSSSDTSSGQQSEAILIDPSAFTAQFELMHDPIGSSIAVTTLVVPIGAPDNSYRFGEGLHHHETGTSRSAARHNPLLVASDVDADVSSLDTDDVPDSSDN